MPEGVPDFYEPSLQSYVLSAASIPVANRSGEGSLVPRLALLEPGLVLDEVSTNYRKICAKGYGTILSTVFGVVRALKRA